MKISQLLLIGLVIICGLASCSKRDSLYSPDQSNFTTATTTQAAGKSSTPTRMNTDTPTPVSIQAIPPEIILSHLDIEASSVQIIAYFLPGFGGPVEDSGLATGYEFGNPYTGPGSFITFTYDYSGPKFDTFTYSALLKRDYLLAKLGLPSALPDTELRELIENSLGNLTLEVYKHQEGLTNYDGFYHRDYAVNLSESNPANIFVNMLYGDLYHDFDGSPLYMRLIAKDGDGNVTRIIREDQFRIIYPYVAPDPSQTPPPPGGGGEVPPDPFGTPTNQP